MYVNQSERVGGKEKEMNEEKDKSREVELEIKQRNGNRKKNVILYPVVCVYCFCSSFKQTNHLPGIKEVYKQCMRCGQRNL